MVDIRTGYRRHDGSTGIRQADAAALAGLTQSKVSRAEQGNYNLQPGEARRYAHALGATHAQIAELVRLCAAAEPSTVAGQARLVRRGAEIQRRISDLEYQSSVIRSWQPTMIPGILQTWAYTTALIEIEPDESWVRHRRGRVALLDDPSRDFHQIVSEATLRWTVGSRVAMDEQLDYLLTLFERSNITIGVVPFGQTKVPPPESAFHLYGDRAAVVATDVGTTFLDDRHDLEAFTTTFGRLSDAAVYDDEARNLIGRAAHAL